MTSTAHNKPGILKGVVGTFLAGLLAALPVALTIAIIIWLVEFLQKYLGPGSQFGKLLGSIGLNFVTSELTAYLIGILATLGLIYLLGLLVQTGMRSHWNALVDGVMERVPLVSRIYTALKKIMRMFESRDQSDMKAMSAVMCYFGGKDGTAVLALMPSPERINMNGQEYYGVLIPTAPVPFGGAILYVPVDWVEPMDMTFDELFNVYMSMGATSADYLASKPEDQSTRTGNSTQA
jgi:uncharacterized membrane protein